jgi:hypothetical protein
MNLGSIVCFIISAFFISQTRECFEYYNDANPCVSCADDQWCCFSDGNGCYNASSPYATSVCTIYNVIDCPVHGKATYNYAVIGGTTGGVVGSLLAAGCLFCVLYVLCCRKKEEEQ